MTNAIEHAVRGLVAVFFTLGNTLLMTPVWLYTSVARKKTSKECPNALQNYLTHFAKAFLYWLTVFRAQPAINTRTPSRLRDWVLMRTFTWIEPVALAKGEKGADESAVFDTTKLPIDLEEREAARKTAGLWFFNPAEPASAPPKAARQSSVLLYFHGGAYITLEAGDIFMGFTLARMQAKHAKVDVLSVNYRLAPQSKYPSQLFEAFSAWHHLRQLGYSHILLGGDSAGANLALTLWRYLHEVAGTSETISGLVLHSPWLDLDNTKRESFIRQIPQCVITPKFAVEGVKALQRSNLPSPQDSWVSPHAWSTETIGALPPLFISNGGAETLFEEATEFVGRAKEQGVRVEHVVMDGHPHDFGAMFWFAPSIKRLFARLGEWVHTVQPKGEP